MNWKHEPEHKLELSNGCETLVRENWTAEAHMARKYLCDGAIKMEIREHRNGSGPKCFGGAERWPHLKLGISFQEGERDKAVKLAEHLKRAIEEFNA